MLPTTWSSTMVAVVLSATLGSAHCSRMSIPDEGGGMEAISISGISLKSTILNLPTMAPSDRTTNVLKVRALPTQYGGKLSSEVWKCQHQHHTSVSM